MTPMKKSENSGLSVDTGTVVLGDVNTSPGDSGYKFLFRCKKDGQDFLGQAGIDVSARSFRVEVFNRNYYARFPLPEERVRMELENKILKLLSAVKKIPDLIVTVIRSLLKQDKQEVVAVFDDEPHEETLELQQIYDRLNQEYFEGKVDARIQWARNTLGQNRRSVRFGSYDHKKKLIRINPRLRQEFVPAQVLELTVYHEMCHQYAPPFQRKGKRLAHHAEFRQKEKAYKHYRPVKQWEKQNWKKLMAPVELED